MDNIIEISDKLFDGIYHGLIDPLLAGISFLLNFTFSPLAFLSPVIQVCLIAVIAAFISILLARRFRSKREKTLREDFKNRLASLKTASSIADKSVKKIVRRGINQQADTIYEKIILDKFSEIGVSYFFPMFFFLIWIEYDLFTPEKLELLTGSSFILITESGTQVSAAYLFIWFFSGFLFTYYLLSAGLRFTVNRGIFKKRAQKKSLLPHETQVSLE